MAKVSITIDGHPIEVEEDSFALQAAEELGISIPTLCYYPHITPYAACRICSVEARDDKGWSKIVTACNYPTWKGLQIYTDTPRVINARRINLEMLMSRCAPLPVLQQLAEQAGIKEPRWGYGTDTCIKCGLCVRICDEMVGAHPKLAPVSTTTDGVYLAGGCQGPKDIPDTVAQGSAAAGQVLKILNQGELFLDAAYAAILEEYCSGCKICNGLCPYNAITFEDEKKISLVNEALCKACGTCAAACPSGAIIARHFTDEQIYAQIEGILA